MIEQKVKVAVQKHSTKLLIFGMIGIIFLELSSNYLFDSGVSPLLTFIFSFSLAVHVFQKVLVDVLTIEKTDK